MQKEELCRRISDLPMELLPPLIQIIQEAQAAKYGRLTSPLLTLCSASDDGEVEIDIEKLDDATLLKVQGCSLPPQRRSPV